MKPACRSLTIACILFMFWSPIHGQDSDQQWSQFRGPNGDGATVKCSVPVPWQATDIKWQQKLPGIGNASPIVWGKTAFIASGDGASQHRYLQAIDVVSGKELWRKTFPLTQHKLHVRNNFAAGTPCVDGAAVYFAYADPQQVVLVAFSHQGEQLWQRELGTFVSQHGFGASPVVHDGLVVLWVSQDAEQLPPGQAPGDSRILAFDAKSGETKWNTSRIATRTCYGTPRLYQADTGPALLFANTAEGVFALDLATGKPLWNRQVFEQRSVASPIIVGDLAIATEGSGAGNNVLYAVNLKGDHQQVFSRNKNVPYVPTPVVKDNLAFLWSDKGIVSCLKLPENQELWVERVGGNVSTSPVIAGDKLIGIAEDGTLTVLSATAAFEKLGTIQLGETTRATPLVSQDYILIRTDSQLLCVGNPS